MAGHTPSALITDQGRQIYLRIEGRFYQLSQEELRSLLGLPPVLPGWESPLIATAFALNLSPTMRPQSCRRTNCAVGSPSK